MAVCAASARRRWRTTLPASRSGSELRATACNHRQLDIVRMANRYSPRAMGRKTTDQYEASADYALGWGDNRNTLTSAIVTNEQDAMQWAIGQVDEMRRDGAASAIRSVKVRRWRDWGSRQARVHRRTPLFQASLTGMRVHRPRERPHVPRAGGLLLRLGRPVRGDASRPFTLRLNLKIFSSTCSRLHSLTATHTNATRRITHTSSSVMDQTLEAGTDKSANWAFGVC